MSHNLFVQNPIPCCMCSQPANLFTLQRGTYWCFGCYKTYNEAGDEFEYIEDGDESEAEADIKQSDDEDEADIEKIRS